MFLHQVDTKPLASKLIALGFPLGDDYALGFREYRSGRVSLEIVRPGTVTLRIGAWRDDDSDEALFDRLAREATRSRTT